MGRKYEKLVNVMFLGVFTFIGNVLFFYNMYYSKFVIFIGESKFIKKILR